MDGSLCLLNPPLSGPLPSSTVRTCSTPSSRRLGTVGRTTIRCPGSGDLRSPGLESSADVLLHGLAQREGRPDLELLLDGKIGRHGYPAYPHVLAPSQVSEPDGEIARRGLDDRACWAGEGHRQRLTTPPLHFANPSPPSGRVEDFHLQTVKHARHTTRCPGEELRSSPGRDLRELALPWVEFIMIDDPVLGKALVGGRGRAGVC